MHIFYLTVYLKCQRHFLFDILLSVYMFVCFLFCQKPFYHGQFVLVCIRTDITYYKKKFIYRFTNWRYHIFSHEEGPKISQRRSRFPCAIWIFCDGSWNFNFLCNLPKRFHYCINIQYYGGNITFYAKQKEKSQRKKNLIFSCVFFHLFLSFFFKFWRGHFPPIKVHPIPLPLNTTCVPGRIFVTVSPGWPARPAR